MVTIAEIEHYMVHRAACVWPSVLDARPRFPRWLRHMEHEGVTSLDNDPGENVLIQLILELFLHGNGQTILMVTHDDEVAVAAQRITQMWDGRVTDDGRGSATTGAATTAAET